LRLDRDFNLFDASEIMLNPAQGMYGREFANAVALVESGLEPAQMLLALKGMERDFGRRPGRRWGSRVLDLDIVAWSGGAYVGRGLAIPHRRLTERRFVLEPLASIAPNWPLLGRLNARHLAHRLARRAPRG
jgi:2-amino-4-hydroxy-6-hydroxymethyldihydropteridine diphosphokinase